MTGVTPDLPKACDSAGAPAQSGCCIAAELAHAAERAQRDRSFALDAVARAR